MIPPLGTCPLCGQPLSEGAVCDPCGRKNRDLLVFSVIALGSFGLLLIFTGFVGYRVWGWNRWVSLVVCVIGVVTIFDAFRGRKRLFGKR